MISRTIKIDCSETAEFIARALRAYNSAPGTDPSQIEWPCQPNSVLMHYVKQGRWIEEQLRKAGMLALTAGQGGKS
jgi:hypothetical protein